MSKEAIISLLSDLKEEDIQSIGGLDVTLKANPILKLCSSHMTSNPHCFWTGREGKIKARSSNQYKSDADIPFISNLFRSCMLESNIAVRKRISFAVSRIFALYSQGPIAVVYLASDKESEPANLTVGTNFWEAELPVLTNLLKIGKLQHIHFFIHRESKWLGPIDLKNLNVPIYRRYIHPLDHKSVHFSFVQDCFKQADYDQWRLEPPRKGINIVKLRKIVSIWRKKSSKRSYKRFIISVLIIIFFFSFI